MKNNVILRQLRYIFDLSDDQMINLFAQSEVEVTRATISDWLKKEDHEEYKEISDPEFASFLNGFINQRRGKREGPQPAPEERLNNNIIFRKLKIAVRSLLPDSINMCHPLNLIKILPAVSASFISCCCSSSLVLYVIAPCMLRTYKVQ